MVVALSKPNATWIALVAALETRLSPQVFETWVRPMTCLLDDGETLRIGMASTFALDWIRNHYRDVIEEELAKLGSARLELSLGGAPAPLPTVEEAPVPAPRPALTAADPAAEVAGRLNPRYVFSSFVVGPSNELAWTASKTVAESRTPTYNPLVLVGGVGLGKTHLLHAVGHACLKRRPPMRVQLKTSEQFVNDVVEGIQGHRMDEVRRRYRDCDVLLIDDIQFISGKSHCQEEFFHTFNALYDAQKQIVVTSDRMPHEIPDLEERVRSRFAWGLIADMKLPQLETRIAIVHKKAEADGLELDEPVATFLAQMVRSNMRELEGCLIRIKAIAALRKAPVTVALVKEVLKGVISDRAQPITCDTIVKTVAGHFDLKVADLKSTRRARNIAFARQIAMYLCRQYTNASYPDIGQALGGKDHTTALYAANRITERLSDPEVKDHIEEIERKLQE